MLVNHLLIAYIVYVVFYGFLKKINCFEAFAAGVKEGTITVVNMYSYFLGFVLLVNMIESCGILADLGSLFQRMGFSPLVFVQALLRPFSAASSYALMLEIYGSAGVDSFSGILSAFIHGISDASVFIIVFYCGAAGIKKYSRTLLGGIFLNIIGFFLANIFALLLS
ncbi:MAG: hypothetical protein GX482_04065 [Acholeplasmataceae bacterium]|nr:hypothetical protein [Acholeplasmataceae bacterium]